MIALRTEAELVLMREANRIVADVLAALSDKVVPGITTGELDAIAEQMIRGKSAVPAFLGYHGYPAVACISVDEEVVHGIPGRRELRDNQIVSIDVGVYLKGYYGDAALSVGCGEIDAERARLLSVTDMCLAKAVDAARAGNRLKAVSCAVQESAEAAGYSVVRSFVGHGIGTEMHEEPQVPNYDTGSEGPLLKSGMVLAIEPMVNIGSPNVRVLSDGWTVVTEDGKPSCHFEHSLVVREDGGEILSTTPGRTWGVAVG